MSEQQIEIWVRKRPRPKYFQARVVIPKSGGRPFAQQYATGDSKELERWISETAALAMQRRHLERFGSVEVRTLLAIPYAEGTPRSRRYPVEAMPATPDIDKLLRTVYDGLTGPVFEDDKQIRRSIAEKIRVDPPERQGVYVLVREAAETTLPMSLWGWLVDAVPDNGWALHDDVSDELQEANW